MYNISVGTDVIYREDWGAAYFVTVEKLQKGQPNLTVVIS
jgi:hypothetical protein